MTKQQFKEKQAVALKYDKNLDKAPVVVAKGRGNVADAILHLAEEHGVPVSASPPVVEILGKLDLGEEIPTELYQAVAEILAFFMLLEAKANSK